MPNKFKQFSLCSYCLCCMEKGSSDFKPFSCMGGKIKGDMPPGWGKGPPGGGGWCRGAAIFGEKNLVP
jgi:hypothetical protein